MGYMGDGLPKWHFDRQKRKKLFTIVKENFNFRKDASLKNDKVQNINEVNRISKYSRSRYNLWNVFGSLLIVIILVSIVLIGIILFS